MDHFELHSPYQPQGDQPQAIKELVSGILEGKHDDIPEQAFLYVGTIEEAVAKSKDLVK